MVQTIACVHIVSDSGRDPMMSFANMKIELRLHEDHGDAPRGPGHWRRVAVLDPAKGRLAIRDIRRFLK
jgi:hypothetical protein